VLYEADGEPVRVRNIGADVAVGDWVVISDDGERVEHVVPRHSGFTRRASFEGSRAVAHTIAANIDVVVLVHALTSPPNQRRLERELVLAFARDRADQTRSGRRPGSVHRRARSGGRGGARAVRQRCER
jgi:putative ribosome biogenesis GTPase RsgA